MFFTFPEHARWNAEWQAVEFGVEIGTYVAWSGCRGACSSGTCPSGPPRRGASRLIISSGPGSRASPSESCAGASWPWECGDQRAGFAVGINTPVSDHRSYGRYST
jgi:hypothetical protein